MLLSSFLWLQQVGATLCWGAQASHCSGFSCCRAWTQSIQTSLAATHRLSRHGTQALEHGLNICGTQAYVPCSTWDILDQGLNPCPLILNHRTTSKVQLCILKLYECIEPQLYLSHLLGYEYKITNVRIL